MRRGSVWRKSRGNKRLERQKSESEGRERERKRSTNRGDFVFVPFISSNRISTDVQKFGVRKICTLFFQQGHIKWIKSDSKDSHL